MHPALTMNLGIGGITAMIAFIYGALHADEVDAAIMLTTCYSFGVLMFMIPSELLKNIGLGRYLTLKRGEKWVKEIEYFYLLLGTVSIISAMAKVPLMNIHLTALDIVAPLILTFAVSMRCIKTRAEIEGWNKKEFYEPKS